MHILPSGSEDFISTDKDCIFISTTFTDIFWQAEKAQSDDFVDIFNYRYRPLTVGLCQSFCLIVNNLHRHNFTGVTIKRYLHLHLIRLKIKR